MRGHSGSQAPHSGPQLWSLAGLTAVSGIGALMWPAIAWAVTGDIQAYTKTETVWRGHDLVPFKPWFDTGVLLLARCWACWRRSSSWRCSPCS